MLFKKNSKKDKHNSLSMSDLKLAQEILHSMSNDIDNRKDSELLTKISNAKTNILIALNNNLKG